MRSFLVALAMGAARVIAQDARGRRLTNSRRSAAHESFPSSSEAMSRETPQRCGPPLAVVRT